jgi:hypothetical protein
LYTGCENSGWIPEQIQPKSSTSPHPVWPERGSIPMGYTLPRITAKAWSAPCSRLSMPLDEKQVILFFYMDDIIILFYSNYQDDFKKLVQQLIELSIKLYNLCQIGSVKWFLGSCVECLLASSQLYLV